MNAVRCNWIGGMLCSAGRRLRRRNHTTAAYAVLRLALRIDERLDGLDGASVARDANTSAARVAYSLAPGDSALSIQ